MPQQIQSVVRSAQRDCCKCRMMQATLQAQYEPLTLMPAPQQMQRQQQQQQAVYQQLALMSPLHMQPATHDFPNMQRQVPSWQQQQLQRQPIRQQLMQLPYTSHTNPAAQQDVYADDQVSFVLPGCQLVLWSYVVVVGGLHPIQVYPALTAASSVCLKAY